MHPSHGDGMTDHDRVQGMWQVQTLEQDGKPAPDAPLLKLVLFKDDKMCFRYLFPRSQGFEYGDSVFLYDFDATTNPKVIRATDAEDGTPLLGISDLDGDSLRLCWNRDEKCEPPSDFTTAIGSQRRLMVLKRWRDGSA